MRFVPTPVWLTDEEARGDWYAYDMCVYRLDHTKRDRNSMVAPYVDPPAPDLPWRRERKLRAERSRYGLPSFVTPLDSELRRILRAHPAEDVSRLALEVQCGRYALSELEAIAGESYWHLQKDYATVADRQYREARMIQDQDRQLQAQQIANQQFANSLNASANYMQAVNSRQPQTGRLNTVHCTSTRTGNMVNTSCFRTHPHAQAFSTSAGKRQTKVNHVFQPRTSDGERSSAHRSACN
ncbi:hypothetical protein [Paraburkholderia unamae]|uniref:Uncharacterized protein n=1 Tax=Paraburkholderia unamae TaxID=219649 RepID=A0ABX5KMD9_9BURK|nr:hypothetical protein [Paraburkholderia unamae]PVX82422.1 hypothetical protein C7402_109276 [Paraburkholderia unamae]